MTARRFPRGFASCEYDIGANWTMARVMRGRHLAFISVVPTTPPSRLTQMANTYGGHHKLPTFGRCGAAFSRIGAVAHHDRGSADTEAERPAADPRRHGARLAEGHRRCAAVAMSGANQAGTRPAER